MLFLSLFDFLPQIPRLHILRFLSIYLNLISWCMIVLSMTNLHFRRISKIHLVLGADIMLNILIVQLNRCRNFWRWSSFSATNTYIELRFDPSFIYLITLMVAYRRTNIGTNSSDNEELLGWLRPMLHNNSFPWRWSTTGRWYWVASATWKLLIGSITSELAWLWGTSFISTGATSACVLFRLLLSHHFFSFGPGVSRQLNQFLTISAVWCHSMSWEGY